MQVRYIYNSSGEYVAFVSGANLFATNGDWLGVVLENGRVYATDGNYMGFITDDDRIVRQKLLPVVDRIIRPMRPLRPITPIRPLRRLRMPVLPYQFVDVFENTSFASEPNAPDLTSLDGAMLYADDGTFLGKISRNNYDADSISNQYGAYGSRYAANSIFNPYGQYGSVYSASSPFNTYTSTPPRITKSNQLMKYLSANVYITPRIDPSELLKWLNKST